MHSDVLAQTEHTISEEGLRNSSAKLIPAGEVIMASRVGLGKACILQHDTAINQDIRALLPLKPSTVDRRFCLYWLQSVKDDIIAAGTGATVQGIKLPFIKSLPFPDVAFEEQKRIVAVLDQAFAALDRALALAEANLADAEELFDGWLTAVFHDHPAEWATRKLRDLCHQITVGHVGPMADRYTSAGTPFLRSQNVRPFRIDLGDVKFIDDAFRSELKKSELRPGDVAIVRTGYPGTAAVIPDDLPLANCADLVIARPKDELHPEFLAMFLNSSFGKKMVAEKSVGAAQKHFNVGAAKEVDFAYPGLEDQRTIVNQMKAMRGHSARLYDQCQAKIDELQELRQALLRQAFAGELT
ncbi:putative Type I restriction-modification system [Erythrobacter dokdonensis DSW-74]|uniref:Putative Type I restriction-modification system n=2 Tax=Erythrobacter TaxID=1041 RepID=A0A1A7BDH1_9SPHN|nr:putative Type I restriction-modification system [Erythrobacter dokdonensis DSW-74]